MLNKCKYDTNRYKLKRRYVLPKNAHNEAKTDIKAKVSLK